MKIGLIRIDLDVKGGGHRQMLKLANNLVKNGHEVYVYTRFFDKKNCYPNLTKELNI